MAVMQALSKLVDIELTVVTLVPEWFLRGSCSARFSIYPLQTDVGLVQKNALEPDIPATFKALSEYYPVRPQTVRSLAAIFSQCSVVVCDISPAGILGSREAGALSVLLENFTWDWIYEGYQTSCPELEPFIQYLCQVNRQADFRVQAMPVCNAVDADLVVPPIARTLRESPDLVRRRLQVERDERLVLLSMGGTGIGQLSLESMQTVRNAVFVVAGSSGEMVRRGNLILLPPETDFFHPDLVAASDAVVGKVGYSTLAEVYHANVPFGYICPHDFRESGPLVSFIRKEMRGVQIDAVDFRQGDWVEKLPQLFQLDKRSVSRQNGAVQCAEFILSLHAG
jgi:hypothetical protein